MYSLALIIFVVSEKKAFEQFESFTVATTTWLTAMYFPVLSSFMSYHRVCN